MTGPRKVHGLVKPPLGHDSVVCGHKDRFHCSLIILTEAGVIYIYSFLLAHSKFICLKIVIQNVRPTYR